MRPLEKIRKNTFNNLLLPFLCFEHIQVILEDLFPLLPFREFSLIVFLRIDVGAIDAVPKRPEQRVVFVTKAPPVPSDMVVVVLGQVVGACPTCKG
jgi:hypothetical protein